MCFNPRTRTGCDLGLDVLPFYALQFQSTHPHGVRLIRPCHQAPFPCFNPRTRTGCDTGATHVVRSPTKFQSTHPHGVRLLLSYSKNKVLFVSIHAPARGATSNIALLCIVYIGFNPRTRTGCDCRCKWKSFQYRCFNPRTRTGCDNIRVRVHLL